MTTYPLEAGEAEPFVPASLADMPDPPTFYLRWGTPRERERQRRVMDEEGAAFHDDASMRAELLRGMKALFSPEDFDTWEPHTKEWWDAIDAYAKEHNDTPRDERPAFEFEGSDMLTEVLEQLARDWRPYRLMIADNSSYNRLIGPAVSSAIIARYENLKTPPRKIGAHLTFDCIREVMEELDEVGRKHFAEKNETLLIRPARDLTTKCTLRLFLGKDAEKNSESPALSDQTPDTSKTGAGGQTGKSKASARSRKTRAGSSGTKSTG